MPQTESSSAPCTVMGGIGRAFDGSYAEYICVPDAQVVAFTTTPDWPQLGALPELLQTAWGNLTSALDVQAGQPLLMRGGTSSVGIMAAQLAKHFGLTVLATTRNPAKVERLYQNGVDHVLLDQGSVSAEVRQHVPKGVDCVLELVGTTTLLDSLAATARQGVVCMSGIVGNAWTLPEFEPMTAIPSTVRLASYSGKASDLLRTHVCF